MFIRITRRVALDLALAVAPLLEPHCTEERINGFKLVQVGLIVQDKRECIILDGLWMWVRTVALDAAGVAAVVVVGGRGLCRPDLGGDEAEKQSSYHYRLLVDLHACIIL